MCGSRPEGFHDPQKNIIHRQTTRQSLIFIFRFRICNFHRHNDFHSKPKSAVAQLSDTTPIIMALRLKKDVQKASYYVWFLGAQESKELRGERVLVSTIPLIDRSRQQEPLKVTLQISHKGLKIIQVSYPT